MTTVTTFHLHYGSEVAEALRAGRPVVALESTIVSHGLPRPDNLRVAREIERAVRDAGAVPATIGMVGGRLVVGLDDAQLSRLATVDGVTKLSVRDLAVAAATGADGATTVAATSAVAAAAGITVFATGGLGGVHREAAQSFDESADLVTLARTPIAVVCAGVKSILDVARPWSAWRPWAFRWWATAPAGSPASSSPTAASTWTGRSTPPSRPPTC